MKNSILLMLVILLSSCTQNLTTDKFEGTYLLKKRRDNYIIKIVKVDTDLYTIEGGPMIGFALKKGDTLYCTTPSKHAVDNIYFTETNDIIFDGDSMKKFNIEIANQIISKKLRN